MATARLHQEHGADAAFTEEEIVARAQEIGGHDPETYRTHVHQRVLATNTSGEGKYAYLTRVNQARPAGYRLFRPGDPAYGRRRRHTAPLRQALPPEAVDLLDWYDEHYVPKGVQEVLHIPVPTAVMVAIRNTATRDHMPEEIIASQVLSAWAKAGQDPFLALAGIGRGGRDDAERHDDILYGG